jgi:hypothetical protein
LEANISEVDIAFADKNEEHIESPIDRKMPVGLKDYSASKSTSFSWLLDENFSEIS